MPLRKVLRSISVDWAQLRAAIAGIGSGWSCVKTPSFRALQGAPCEALCRFAHLGSETFQKRAKRPLFFKISISPCTESRTRVDSSDSQVACPAKAPTACLTTRPTRHWKYLRVGCILRLAMRETTVNCKFAPVRAQSSRFWKVSVWILNFQMS